MRLRSARFPSPVSRCPSPVSRLLSPVSCLLSPVLCAAFVLGAAVPAAADITAFFGRTSNPDTRAARGLAIGTGLLIVGFEFEYSSTDEELTPDDPADIAPAIKTYMFNGLLQTPVPIARMQFYGTIGGGVYHETLSLAPDASETNFGTNVGGGVKVTLVGPLRARVDYRVFSLRGAPRHTNVQRWYVGVNLKF
jgi:opacity protein-like surface antigen